MVRPRAPWTDTEAVRNAVARALYAAARVETRFAVAGTILSLMLMAAIDRAAGPQWSLGLLYYLPIAFAAWRLGRDFALTAGLISTAGWFLLTTNGRIGEVNWLALGWSAVAHLVSFAVVAVLVSEVRELFERERTNARFCHLTGALTGRAFRNVLDQAVLDARRRQTGLALVYVDMDDFKLVNDEFGHAAGDAVLEAFSAAVRNTLEEGDHLARTGGDEFVILLAGRRGRERTAIELVRANALTAMRALDSQVSASMGAIVVPPGRIVDPGDLVRRADSAMYEAKRGGKGSICVFEIGERPGLHIAAA